MELKANEIPHHCWIVFADGNRIRMRKLGVNRNRQILVVVGENSSGTMGTHHTLKPDYKGMVEINNFGLGGVVKELEPCSATD